MAKKDYRKILRDGDKKLSGGLSFWFIFPAVLAIGLVAFFLYFIFSILHL